MSFDSPDGDYSHDQYIPPSIDEGGVYMLDDPWSAAEPYAQGPLVHPRTRYPGQRYPGPMGAGRKETYVRAQWHREAEDGERDARYVLDKTMWDPRPPHYNPDAGAEHAHLAVGPRFQGPPRVPIDTTRSQARTTSPLEPEHFRAGRPTVTLETLELMRIILIVIIVMMLGMYLTLTAAQKSMRRSMREMIRDVLWTMRVAKQ